MHIQKVEIRNIKSIKEFDMAFKPDEPLAGWHVLIGDNGSGKSTVLKAIALALVGALNAWGLNENWGEWVNPTENEDEEYFTKLSFNYIDAIKNNKSEHIKFNFDIFYKRRNSEGNLIAEDIALSEDYSAAIKIFSAAYGPFRRFTGSSEEYDRIFKSNPKLAAHLTVFREDAALSEIVGWLLKMRLQELEFIEEHGTDQSEHLFLHKLREFINSDDFLPYGVKLSQISSKGVFFTDAHGSTITIQNLSDGYRSILSLTLEMIRQMQIAYQSDDLFTDDFKAVKMPGVVLIDEVDAHLHPTWQRRIGFWFRQHFPNIQFIVTSHSPLICQAAAEGGSVWKLPKPGTDEVCVRVEGQDLNRLLYGNILEAYSTQLFGLEKRPEKSEEKLDRLAELNIKEVFEGLSREEKDEQEELRAMFPTASNKIEEHE